MKHYLGADVSSSKTQISIADEKGQVAGLGFAGPGNHQTVGYDGMFSALKECFSQALNEAGISVEDISGAGFDISGYDWPSDKPRMIEIITRLGLQAALEMYNDAVLGLLTGFGDLTGETAGRTELVYRAMQLVAQAWTNRGQEAALTQAFVEHVVPKVILISWKVTRLIAIRSMEMPHHSFFRLRKQVTQLPAS
jgi:hypothetical protein